MTTSHQAVTKAQHALLIIGLVCLGLHGEQQDNKQLPPDVFNVKLREVSPLQALTHFASENRLPIGIVVSSSKELCRQLKNVDLDSASVEQVLNALIPTPGYTWSREGSAFVVRPGTLPDASDFLLQLRLGRFGSMRATIQGAGLVLAARVEDLLHPRDSFALSILSSEAAEEIDSFTLNNVSVEEAANYIVSQGKKGLWIMYPVPDDHQHIADVQRLYTYGYADDVGVISGLSCANPKEPPNPTK